MMSLLRWTNQSEIGTGDQPQNRQSATEGKRIVIEVKVQKIETVSPLANLLEHASFEQDGEVQALYREAAGFDQSQGKTVR
jgi:hypothetical protein